MDIPDYPVFISDANSIEFDERMSEALTNFMCSFFVGRIGHSFIQAIIEIETHL